jgi:hypothetical protein
MQWVGRARQLVITTSCEHGFCRYITPSCWHDLGEKFYINFTELKYCYVPKLCYLRCLVSLSFGNKDIVGGKILMTQARVQGCSEFRIFLQKKSAKFFPFFCSEKTLSLQFTCSVEMYHAILNWVKFSRSMSKELKNMNFLTVKWWPHKIQLRDST